MRIFRFLRKPRSGGGEPAEVRCEARIGVGRRCENMAVPGKKLCSFHGTLLGPWSQPDQHFRDID